MFTLEDADQLRDSLHEMDFHTPRPSDGLAQSYAAFYGLNFELEVPEVIHSMGWFQSLQFRIACQYFAVPSASYKGTVIVVHGFYDHVGLYGHLIRHCLLQGYSVLAFDLPGHGLSSGNAASIDSFNHYSQALADLLLLAQQMQIGEPWLIIGQSTGAAALLNYLLKKHQFQQFEFDKIILMAPLIKPLNWVRGQLLYYLLHLFIRKYKRDFTANSHDPEFLRFIREDDPLQSRYLALDWINSLKSYLADFEAASPCNDVIHIVQGTEDGTVDWQYNLPKIIEKFPEAIPYMIDGAQHHMVNESAQIRTEIFSAVDAIIKK